jgi:RNA polymerase sigma-70 factor (ECF subfamily)
MTRALDDNAPDALDLQELMRSHRGLVARALARAGIAERDVPDLVQEVFIVAYRRLPEWEGRAKLSTWLYRVALRVASDHRRRAYQRREVLQGLDASTLEATLHPLAECEQLPQLWAAFEQLSEEHKQALFGYEIEELSVAEIAAQACVPQKTVYSRLSAARRVLRQLLVAQGWALLVLILKLPRRCFAAISEGGVPFAHAAVFCCLLFLAPTLPLLSAPAAVARPLQVAFQVPSLPASPLRAAASLQPLAAPVRRAPRTLRKHVSQAAVSQTTTAPKSELKVIYVGSIERPEGELPFGFERVAERPTLHIAVRGPRDAIDGLLPELAW